MCENKQKPEPEPCYEKRELRNRSHVHEKELRSWNCVISTAAPQPWL